MGTFRAGIWYEDSYTDRFQTPTSPMTWVDAATPNFHEKFITQSLQPYAQYEYNVTRKLTFTAGFKFSNYDMKLTQYQDNGKTIGCLGGTTAKDPVSGATNCVGGAQFVTHDGFYHAFQPTADLRYRVRTTGHSTPNTPPET